MSDESFEEVRQEILTRPISAMTDCLEREVAALLRKHGCKIHNHGEYQAVLFPPGTKSEVKLITSSARYLLTLPTGLVVRQVEAPNRDYWLLFVDMPIMQNEESNGRG